MRSRTVTEQRQKLELEESRSIIENVRAETASLRLEHGNFQDTASILSMDPSVNFDVDSILLKSPAYRRVYGNVSINYSLKYINKTKCSFCSVVPVCQSSLRNPYLLPNFLQGICLPRSSLRKLCLFPNSPSKHHRSRLDPTKTEPIRRTTVLWRMRRINKIYSN